MTEIATFGAGCFWGPEDRFMKMDGVEETAVGFMGGKKENPTYEEVSWKETGHAEVVHLKYNPEKISYKELLEEFFKMHDPTEVNKQGPDIGTQYRSVIFYHNLEQKAEAESFKKELQERGVYSPKTIATSIEPATTFWKAEEYHQKYIQKTGRNVC